VIRYIIVDFIQKAEYTLNKKRKRLSGYLMILLLGGRKRKAVILKNNQGSANR